MHHKVKTLIRVNKKYIYFHQIINLFSLKMLRALIGLSKILLTNGAGINTSYGLQSLRTFLVNFQNVY